MAAHEIDIYTKETCRYCMRAKDLLNTKGAAFREIRVDDDEAVFDRMVERAGGRRSVPQIFIDGRHIGGCDDLHDLDAGGDLDDILA